MIDFKIDKNYKFIKTYIVNKDGSFYNIPSKDKFMSMNYKTKYNFLKALNLLPLEIYDKDYKFTEAKLNSLYTKYCAIYKKYGRYYKVQNGIKADSNAFQFKERDIKNWDKTKEFISKETGFPEWLAENIEHNILFYTFNQEANADKILVRDLYIENARPFDGVIYRGLSFDHDTKYDDFMESIKDEITSSYMGINQNLSWTYSEHVAEYFSIGWNSIGGNTGAIRVLIKCINNLTGVPIKFLSNNSGEDEILTNSKTIWDIVEIEKSENPLQEIVLITCVERPREKEHIDASEIKKENLYFIEFLTVKAVKEYKVKATSRSDIENWINDIFLTSKTTAGTSYDKLLELKKKMYSEYEESKYNHEYEKIHKQYLDIINKW